jgi:hypothetical protein
VCVCFHMLKKGKISLSKQCARNKKIYAPSNELTNEKKRERGLLEKLFNYERKRERKK